MRSREWGVTSYELGVDKERRETQRTAEKKEKGMQGKRVTTYPITDYKFNKFILCLVCIIATFQGKKTVIKKTHTTA
ncbi:MAG: hypothetical protein PHE33_12240 [Bacteroidales bacterium]|nr:hypothetical protein [Bacteroidales bacterium]